MRYAVKQLSDGLILNCIALDPALAQAWKLPDGHVLIEAETEGGPGDTHDEKLGFIPGPSLEPIPQPRSELDALIAALAKKGVVTKEDVEAEKVVASIEAKP